MGITPVDQVPRDIAKAGAHLADANLLRDRVTAAIGDLYFLGAEVGRGGMAVVYAAEDVRLQRKVALKVLPPELAFRADVRERFVREAQTAARLNHPHIVPIYAVHETGGLVCFAMSLVEGESLAARIAREPRPSFGFIASILEQTADALAYAHACGVVHRDVKPDNVLLDRESGRAMVTDFGIARAAESGSRLTQTGIAVGTPAFMSPEQAMGDREVDGRSDLYSVGVVGYLMLAGRLPFEASSTPSMLMKHVSETPPPLRASRPDAPRVLVEILERCLAKRPQDRWESAIQLRDALRLAQRDGSLGASATPAGHTAQAGRPSSAATAPRDARDGRDDARYGHRSEDWAPRQVLAPAPAPRAHPAPGVLPPMPQLPPLPVGADRHMAREWKQASREAMKDWRHAVREQRRDMRNEWRDQYIGTRPERSDDDRIRGFRRQLVGTAGLSVFLVVINAASGGEPWFVFPVGALALGNLVRFARLRARGITLGRILGRSDAQGAPRIPSELNTPAKVADAVQRFRSRVKWMAGAAVTSIASFVIGASLNADPMIVPFVGALLVAVGSGQMSLVEYLRLKRAGVPLSDALSGNGWRRIAATADTRPYAARLDELINRLGGSSLLASHHGETVRNAAEDRLVIQDVMSKLTEMDRSLVPDVEPTADALLERVGALANGLERLDRDLPGDALPQLTARIAAVQAEPENAPDRERRLTLLTRQQGSLQELAARRDTMARQLESASMALRSLRFDIVKLRTMGVDAAKGDLTSATQEARALSRDLGYVLDAAEEARKL
jgi:serine/threonine-protein kinase